MYAIEVHELTRRYGYRVALRNVSFTIATGGIHALFGANGAGKTTLMRVISTLLQPHGGYARVYSLDTQEEPLKVKEKIGVVGDKPLLYGELTGRENLRFYSTLYGLARSVADERIENLADRFGVKSWLDEPTKILSTGLRKRFDIIRSVLHDPEVYLLDEPFAGLDKDSTEVFKEFIESHRSDRTVLLTTHNLALGSEMSDDYITLKMGKVLSHGPISQFDGVI
ncbi:MAG: ABC transporter ATP-binding protein [Candidatus Thorarchaeota archaeon]